MKRALAFSLAALLAFGLAACGSDPSSSSSSSVASSSLPVASSAPELFVREMPQQDLNINLLTGTPRAETLGEGQRPLAVTVANNRRALPQRGIAAADVVYEMVTEGGITRLMAMYADYNTLPQVGPVRSTRDQFLQFALPQNSIPVQIGASIYASNLLNLLSYKTVDGIRMGTTAFFFDEARAHPKPEGKLNEYCWFTDAGLVWNGMTLIDVLPTGEVPPLFWFAEGAAAPATEAYSVTLNYSSEMGASFVYDEASGLYQKNVFYHFPEYYEAPHADEDGTRLAYTNLIVLTCPITLKPDGQCTEFDLTGGEGYYFTAGGVQPITWQKGDVLQPLHLFDANGQMLQVQRGKSYIGVLDAAAAESVLYQSKDALAAPPAA